MLLGLVQELGVYVDLAALPRELYGIHHQVLDNGADAEVVVHENGLLHRFVDVDVNGDALLLGLQRDDVKQVVDGDGKRDWHRLLLELSVLDQVQVD